jgi:Oligosaccharide biosynthesis protein Alg14 like
MSVGKLRVLLVSSSGGVLLDLLAMRPWWEGHDVSWVSVRASDTESALAGESVVWEPEQSARAPLGVARGVRRAWRTLGRERPDLIVSAGTGVAVAFFAVAKVRRIPSVWVETFNMVASPGLAARLCARLADRVLVQREEIVDSRPRSVLIGELY